MNWRLAAAAMLMGLAARAQQMPQAAGHWAGTVNPSPEQEALVTVDLARTPKGRWIGSLSMPDAHTHGIPLTQILVDGYSVRFVVAGAPGDPSFVGKLSPDGAKLSGTYTLKGEHYPFELERTGEAEVDLPPPSSPLVKEFTGTWQGVLDDGDEHLHMILKLERAPDGTGTGTITSVDQDNTELPLTTVTQKSRRLLFEVRTIGASFSGAINAAATEISGEWAQPSGALPLVFRRK